MFLDKKLCLFQIDVSNTNELFTEMANKLHGAGCVKETFLDGIVTREAEYPTALEVNGIGFAIPHTDSVHVNKSQICFASLKDPLIFSDMTNKENKISVKLVFMLAMAQPHEQIETLQNLVELFQDTEKVEKLLQCTTTDAFLKLVNSAGVK